MVCPRCLESVSDIAAGLKLPVSSVELGSVELTRPLTDGEQEKFGQSLSDKGFELVFDRETELVTLVKGALAGYIRHLEESEHPEKLSVYVSEKNHYNYSYLSKVFSEATGETIENHLIRLKIERVKELLQFRKWTLSEIAWKLNYSSVQYLSNQFKKVTGMTVTQYRKKNRNDRISLDSL